MKKLLFLLIIIQITAVCKSQDQFKWATISFTFDRTDSITNFADSQVREKYSIFFMADSVDNMFYCQQLSELDIREHESWVTDSNGRIIYWLARNSPCTGGQINNNSRIYLLILNNINGEYMKIDRISNNEELLGMQDNCLFSFYNFNFKPGLYTSEWTLIYMNKLIKVNHE